MQVVRKMLSELSDGYLRYIMLTICISLAAVAIIIAPEQMNLENVNEEGVKAVITLFFMELRTVEFVHLIAIVFITYLFNQFLLNKEEKFEITAAWISCILSIFLICGMSLSNYHDLSFLFGRKAQIPIAISVFLGILLILYTVLKIVYRALDQKRNTGENRFFKRIDELLETQFLLKVFLLLVLVWLLQALPFFPGSVAYDGRYQLNQFFGYSDMNLHHPYYATMLMGTIYSIGSKFFGYVGGCVFYVLFQCMFGAWIFGCVCKYVRVKTKSIKISCVCILFYALAPMWWTYIQSLDKSSVSFICVTWFALEYLKIILEKEITVNVYIQMVIAGVCSCLFRNDSKYVIIVALIVLFILKRKKWKKILLSSASIVILSSGLNAIPSEYLGLTSWSPVESLSVPLQQIARYVTFYGEELTPDEKHIIDRVVQYDGIEDRYDPELSDPVKNIWRSTTKEEFEEFFALWLKKLEERPGVYITATLNNVYGYTDPFYFYTGLSRYHLYNKNALGDYDTEIVYSKYIFSDKIRSTVSNITDGWCKTPFWSFVVSPGAYTWLGFIMLGAVLRRRKWDYAFSFCIPILLTLVCFASPVNGLLRYSLPIMAIAPLYVMIGILPYIECYPVERTVKQGDGQ